MIKRLIDPDVQIWFALAVVTTGFILLILVLLRFVPILDQFAIAKKEPFWVLLLSVAALLYSGFSALPAALAYRESKITNL